MTVQECLTQRQFNTYKNNNSDGDSKLELFSSKMMRCFIIFSGYLNGSYLPINNTVITLPLFKGGQATDGEEDTSLCLCRKSSSIYSNVDEESQTWLSCTIEFWQTGQTFISFSADLQIMVS